MTVVVSTGDSGAATTACPARDGSAAVKGVDLPASDPLALAVGGTSLQASRATGAYIGETAWNIPASAGGPDAGGGGFSRLFPGPPTRMASPASGPPGACPTWPPTLTTRTGMAIAFSDGGNDYILIGGGGTSVAAPLWAAVIALADQYAGRDLGFVNPALYRIGRSAYYHQAFHDVTTGTNTVTFPTPDHHRLPGRARVGPGHRLGKPQRAGARPPARPLRQPMTRPTVPILSAGNRPP